jgi:hypothetical protein
MKLKYLTITGADDSINPDELIELSQSYKFSEWGILISKNQTKDKPPIKYNTGSRFPSRIWMNLLNDLINLESASINLSGHLCGSWLYKDLLTDGNLDFTKDIPLWDKFSRIQLNFHGETILVSRKGIAALRYLSWEQRKEIIVQMDGVNNKLFLNFFNAGITVFPLFDVSHGTGVLPNKWPTIREMLPNASFDFENEVVPNVNSHIFRGYAGGLGPNNLAEQLIKIEEVVGNDEIWADMETKVRTNHNQLFDLDKVKTCLKIVQLYTNV